MFYCDECQKAEMWPKSFSKSVGNCEVCGNYAECNDVPSSSLPAPVKTDPKTNKPINQ